MSIVDTLQKRIDELRGGEMVEEKEKVGRKAYLTDPYLEVSSSHGTFRQKYTRLSNRLLKESCLRDSVMSAIIRLRRTQVERFCKIPNNRHDTGYAMVRRDGTELTIEDRREVAKILDFIYFCGSQERVPTEDKSTLATELGMCVEDALIFGHLTIEKIRDHLNPGKLHRFRHVPSESIFHRNKQMPQKQLQDGIDQLNAVTGLVRVGSTAEDEEKIRYLQVIDAREVASFSDETMIFKLYQPPSFIDNNGYSMSLVERCILSITRHLQAENYNALFFTHGFAARGLLHLKGNVSQANLQAFRQQFNAQINGNNNSWRTPIIAGLDDVKYLPLAGSQRDMEYIQYTDHLIRTLCAQAQCDPTEIGFEYLSKGTQQSTLNSPNNEWKLTASQERGLYPILRFVEDIVNHDLLPEIDKEASKKYMFKFVGLEIESKQQEVARLQAEATVHASLNDILQQVNKPPLAKDLAADVPLNGAWITLLKSLRTVGELREELLGDVGASKRPELQYIPDPLYIQYQQMLSMKDQQAQQAQQQADQAEQERVQANMSGGTNTPSETQE